MSLFRGRWGQEVIFEVAEAKIWISSSFNKFSFRIFVVLDFEVVWPRRPQRPRKRLVKIFWKLPQNNANFPKINGRFESLGEVAFKPNTLSSEEWLNLIGLWNVWNALVFEEPMRKVLVTNFSSRCITFWKQSILRLFFRINLSGNSNNSYDNNSNLKPNYFKKQSSSSSCSITKYRSKIVM